jgi:hypothetical protein
LDVEASQVCKLMVLLKKTYSINKACSNWF